jgi:photosystem II stability/assembly factor-like uncharacterized protein
MSRPFLTIVLPVAFIGALQLVSCTPQDVAPAKPGGVYYSSSGGAKFDQSVDLVDEDESLLGYIDKFEANNIHRPAHEPSTIYLTAGSEGVVVSNNDGESWQTVDVPLIRVTAFVSLKNGIWLASGTNEDNEGIVIRTLDKGESWDSVLTIPAATEEDGGFFQIIKPPPPAAIFVSSLVPDPFDEERVYATTSTGDVLAGEDSGKVWHTTLRIKATRSDPLTGRGNTPVIKIIPSPHTPEEVMLISGDGSIIRANKDERKKLTMPRGRAVDIVYINQFPEALFISLTSGVYVSRDKGETWVELSVPISKSQPLVNSIVRVSPTNPNRIIVSVNNIIYRSEDGGDNWNTLSLELPSHIITDISINPKNAAKVILTTIPFRT